MIINQFCYKGHRSARFMSEASFNSWLHIRFNTCIAVSISLEYMCMNKTHICKNWLEKRQLFWLEITTV